MRLNTHARSLFLPALAAAALAACSDDSTAPADKFTGPTGFTLLQASNPIDITADGRTVVVEDLLGSFDNPLYFYDVVSGAYTLQDERRRPVPGLRAPGVSSDLKVSAIYGDPAATGVWSEADRLGHHSQQLRERMRRAGRRCVGHQPRRRRDGRLRVERLQRAGHALDAGRRHLDHAASSS